MSRAKWVGLTLLALVVALLAWGLTQVEWVEQDSGSRPTDKARQEPYLAAVRYLETLGTTVEQEQGLFRLDNQAAAPTPEAGDTILLIDAYGMLSEARAQRLLQWVEAGGQLVMGARNPYVSEQERQRDALFDYFGVSVERDIDAHVAEVKDSPRTVKDLLAPEDPCEQLLVPLAFAVEGDPPLQVAFPDWLTLATERPEEATILADSLGPRLVQFRQGAGRVTFVTGTELWSNRYIACHDNAYLLGQLTYTDGRVWLLVNQDAPSLLTLLWQRAPTAVLASLLFIALFLWRRAVRFGPIEPVAQEHRRSLLEHIDAAAGFLWRQRQGEALVTPLRQEVLAQAARRREWDRTRSTPDYELLARLTAMPAEQIEQALVGSVDSDEAFVSAVTNLKRLKERL